MHKKTVATRAAPFGSDMHMHQIVCRLGLLPRPNWGSLQRSPRPPSWFRGWGPRGKGRREGRGKRGRGREGRRGSPGMPKSRVGKPSHKTSRGLSATAELLVLAKRCRFWPHLTQHLGPNGMIDDSRITGNLSVYYILKVSHDSCSSFDEQNYTTKTVARCRLSEVISYH